MILDLGRMEDRMLEEQEKLLLLVFLSREKPLGSVNCKQDCISMMLICFNVTTL